MESQQSDGVEKPRRVSKTESQKKKPSKLVRCSSTIIENKYFVGFTTVLTIAALTADDFRMMTTTKSFDDPYNVFVGFMFLVFAIECTLSCIGKDDYFLGFFFWLDLISTTTILLDITFVMPWVFGTGGNEEDDDASSQGDQARAGRSAKIGAKAGRVVRVLRLVRILKLYKAYYEAKMRKKMEEERKKRGDKVDEDDWADEEMGEQEDPADGGTESRVGKKLSETTTRRVICLILAMLLVLPALQVDMQPATSADYGADYILRTFNYMQAGNISKAEYDKSMLQFIYYHNWYAKESQFCPRGLCADQFYGNLFWIGVRGSDLAKVNQIAKAAQLDPQSVTSFEAAAAVQDDIYNYGLMPAEAREILAGPWDIACDKESKYFYRGISLLEKEVDDVNSHTVNCAYELRDNEVDDPATQPRSVTVEQKKEWNFIFYFDVRRFKREEAMFSVFTTLFVLVLLVLGSMMFSNDAKRLVVNPVEKMIKRVEAIRENPLIAIRMADEEFKAEEIANSKKRNREKSSKNIIQDLWSCQMCQSKAGSEPMETVVLEKTIIKLGSLLALGFGEAGANIIGHNMSGSDTAGVNAMIPGTHVDCVIGVARVKDFSTATEVLQAKIMTFVNQVAEIVHGVVNDFHGAPNKNNGDAFLIIWRLDQEAPKKANQSMESSMHSQRLAEMSITSFATILGALHRSPLLATYRGHPGLQNRLGTNCRVNLCFGLHLGWAIEGAVGSEFKIDASYLSPNVSIATSVERATEVYSVSLLVAESVVSRCGLKMRNKCRLIDNVIIKGSARAMGLYCLDLDYRSVKVAEDAPLGITWSTRKRFEARQILETSKNTKMAQDFDIANLLDTDPTLLVMRQRYTVEFFQLFNMGFQNYCEGEWQVARKMLSCTRAILGIEDGPSNALLRFMESPYGFEAPKNWKGVREVETKSSNNS